MKKLNYKEIFSKINFQFSKKNSILIFLLLFIGVLLPTLSGSSSFNFWNKLYNILNNPIYNMLLFISIGVNVIYFISDMINNHMIVSRYNNYKKVIKIFLRYIAIFTIYLMLVSFIMAIAGAIIFSFGDFKMINHSVYDIPIIIYILFFLIRSIIIACIINSIIYLLSLLLNKFIMTIIILLNGSIFFLISYDMSFIEHFYDMHLLYHYYYNSINYGSIFLELIVSIIQILLLIIISKIIFGLVTRKKRDLL